MYIQSKFNTVLYPVASPRWAGFVLFKKHTKKCVPSTTNTKHMSYYVTTIAEAKKAAADRKSKRHQLRPMIDQFIANRYGVKNFSAMVFDPVVHTTGCTNEDTTFGVLARQVPGVATEDVACHMLAHQMGFTPLPLAFSRDCFVVQSNDKKYRAQIPFVRWSRKGSLVIEHQKITPQKELLDRWNMVRMDHVAVDAVCGGGVLPMYHRQMYHDTFKYFPGGDVWFDVSMLYAELLASALDAERFPEHVWKQNGDGRDRQCDGSTCPSDEARSLILRPSAKWYYCFYLSMFLDGTFVLMETYDNPAGGVPEARKLFEREMDLIERHIGIMPLVVQTFPLEIDMLYVNRHIVEQPDRAATFLQEQKCWSDNTVKLTRWFADRAIQFRG